MANTTDFKSRWALVTGASAGIGAGLARELASHGAKLILTARRRDRLQALAQELMSRGTEVRIVVADLLDPNAPRQIYDSTEGAGIPVDILINNAELAQSRIVDEDVDGNAGAFCRIVDLSRRIWIEKIRDDDPHLGSARHEFLRKRLETVTPSRCEDEFCAVACEFARKSGANAGAGASNQCPPAFEVGRVRHGSRP